MAARTRSAAGRIVWGILLAAALLYGGAQAGIRSPWFRVAVEHRLSKLAGMEVRIGDIRATESLNLRIGRVSALDERAGMEVRVLRVKWSFFAPRGLSRIHKLSAEDVTLTMAPDDDGRLMPAFVGDHAWELIGRLTRDMVPAAPVPDAWPGGKDAVEETPSGIGGILHMRIVRGVFSLRDASGRERASARDISIDRIVERDADGHPVERLEVQADVLTVEGMQLTGVDWAAERTDGSDWTVLRFTSDDWSGWTPADAEALDAATGEYRALLDSF